MAAAGTLCYTTLFYSRSRKRAEERQPLQGGGKINRGKAVREADIKAGSEEARQDRRKIKAKEKGQKAQNKTGEAVL